MSDRIDARFEELRQKRRKGFIAYVTAGDPEPKITVPLVLALEKSGADIVELGVPFSDPLADGVVNQRAAERALLQGVTLRTVLNIVADIRRHSEVPIVLFTYLNPVFSYGFERFSKDAARSGVDGILSLDLPPEEGREYEKKLRSAGIKTIYIVAPTTPNKRIKMIARHAGGFIYYVSRTGVTGERKSLNRDLASRLLVMKSLTKKPIAVGFGISTPGQVRAAAQHADAVVVGSALVREMEVYGKRKDIIERVSRKVARLAAPLKR